MYGPKPTFGLEEPDEMPSGHDLNSQSQNQGSNQVNINMNIMNIGLTGVQPPGLPTFDPVPAAVPQQQQKRS